MIEQYDKEMSQVHAPSDLIQRTKAAMRQEEERLQANPKEKDGTGQGKRRKKWGWILTPVAAALVLAVFPAAFLGSMDGKEVKPPVRAGREEPSVSLLPQGDLPLPRLSGMEATAAENTEEGTLKKVSEKTAEFGDAEPVEMKRAKVWAAAGEDGWKAYIETEDGAYLYTDQADSIDEFLKKVGDVLDKERTER